LVAELERRGDARRPERVDAIEIVHGLGC
jgi:hypothetical protein